jgi:hypothetical protein
MASHSRDSVSADAPFADDPQVVCRSAATTLTAATPSVRRFAVFQFPRPPAGERFPDDTAHLDRHCVLRRLWIEVAEPDSLAAIALAGSVDRELTAKFGAPAPHIDLPASGSAKWTNGRTWQYHATTVALGITPHEPGMNDAEHQRPERVHRIIIAAYGAASGLGVDDWQLDLDGWAAFDEAVGRASLMRADSAIQWSGLDQAGRDLRDLVSRLRQFRRETALSRDTSQDSVLVRAVNSALRAATTQPTGQRAASLLAIDIVIAAHAGTLDMDSTKSDARLRRLLDAAGARYEVNPLGAVYTYTRPFLWEAQRLDSAGPAGRAAFVELLATGFNTRPGCHDSTSGYRRVIADGERVLAGRAPFDPLVRLYVAEAHADIVAMASGVVPRDYVDPADFQREAASARQRAIVQYRTALTELREPAFRRAAWRGAFRLGVGSAGNTRFVCIYD